MLLLKIAASAYMAYLAYRIAMSSFVQRKKIDQPMTCFNGILLNLINPKAYIAAFSSLTLFSMSDNIISSTVILIAINIFVAIVFQGVWVFFGEKLSSIFNRPYYNKIINITLSIIMISMVVFTLMN